MGGDTQLKRRVVHELRWLPGIDEAAIGVSVHDAIVTLAGHVQSYAEKMAAERAVMGIHGVKALVSELAVLLPRHERTDEEIAQDAVSVLQGDAAAPRDAVKAKVTKGWVTLSGAVESQFERHNAERMVSHLFGVKGVTNEIKDKTVTGARQSKNRQ